jgi:hypothetical protein
LVSVPIPDSVSKKGKKQVRISATGAVVRNYISGYVSGRGPSGGVAGIARKKQKVSVKSETPWLNIFFVVSVMYLQGDENVS